MGKIYVVVETETYSSRSMLGTSCFMEMEQGMAGDPGGNSLKPVRKNTDAIGL